MAAEAEARRRGADDAVFVDGDGVVLEGPVTNIWWRREPHAVHAVARARHPRRRDARRAPRARAARLGYASRRARSALDDLAAADEAFTSSSVREVLPVVELDGRPIGARPGGGRAAGRAADDAAGATPSAHEPVKVRLGGMALAERRARPRADSWACAVRTATGEIKVASAPASALIGAGRASSPLLRGPARLLESSRSCRCAAAARGAAAVRAPGGARGDGRQRGRPSGRAPLDGSARCARELARGLALARARRCSPCAAASSRPTTAPSTSRSGRYEHGEPRAREHERCGSHLIGPLLVDERPPATCSPRARLRTCAGPARAAARSAPSAPRPSSSPG